MARELRRERQEAAKDLRQVVEKVLEELGMGDTLFSVLFEQRGTIRKTGAEDVIFAIARGERSFSPLEEIASGGELSRILLALHVACPEGMLPPVLIFDEIDSGIGTQAEALVTYILGDDAESGLLAAVGAVIGFMLLATSLGLTLITSPTFFTPLLVVVPILTLRNR